MPPHDRNRIAGVRIRAFRPDDAAALAAIFHAAVREVASRDYSVAQVAAWSPAPPASDRYVERGCRHLLLVATDGGDRPLAYGDIAPGGYLDHLYCAPGAIGSGVASLLYAALKAGARASGATRLLVDASETARPFFTRHGFRLEGRREVVLGGVALHNYRMVKPLVSCCVE